MDKIKQIERKIISIDDSQLKDIKTNIFEEQSKNNFKLKERVFFENKKKKKK